MSNGRIGLSVELNKTYLVNIKLGTTTGTGALKITDNDASYSVVLTIKVANGSSISFNYNIPKRASGSDINISPVIPVSDNTFNQLN